METSSGCLKSDAACRTGRPIRGPHGGWQKQEIEALQKSIEEAAKTGESLRSVFDRLSLALGRKPNSIRNFYYAQVRSQESGASERALPFETFSPDEVERLVQSVLTDRAQGMSVRASVRRLAGGDRTRMLRYQNKYRSVIRTRPELVQRVMDRLAREGVPFVSPYAGEPASQEYDDDAVRERARQTPDPRIHQLFSALDYLMDLAYSPKDASRAASLTIQESEAQRRADRLDAQCGMLRIALSDRQERSQELRDQTMGMVTLIKEYIALPQQERASQSALFCQQAAARLSAVECALMEPEP